MNYINISDLNYISFGHIMQSSKVHFQKFWTNEVEEMKAVRISAGAGYAGDRIEPALENIRRGNVDYIMFECLAERTIALAQKDRAADPQKGYNRLLEYRMERCLLYTSPSPRDRG